MLQVVTPHRTYKLHFKLKVPIWLPYKWWICHGR